MSSTFVREATVVYGPASTLSKKTPIASSAEVVAFFSDLIADRMTESFVALVLDSRSRPMAWSEIGRGSVTACPVSPVDVLRFVVVTGGAHLIVAHNHPSGDPSPSPEDIVLTQRLEEACRLLGIRFLDHVIVGEAGTSFSFLDRDLIGKKSR